MTTTKPQSTTEPTSSCDYRNKDCAATGVTIGGKWICNNHICEQRQQCWLNANARLSPCAAPVVDNKLHWQSKAGAEEAMCGRLAKEVRCTVLQDFATCEICKAVAFGYQMGRADERAAAATAAPVEQLDPSQPHDWVGTGDNCELPGCRLGVLEHLKLPEIDFSK